MLLAYALVVIHYNVNSNFKTISGPKTLYEVECEKIREFFNITKNQMDLKPDRSSVVGRMVRENDSDDITATATKPKRLTPSPLQQIENVYTKNAPPLIYVESLKNSLQFTPYSVKDEALFKE